MGALISFVFASKGLMRGLSALFAAPSLVPAFKDYAAELQSLSAVIGAGGLTRAALRMAFSKFLDSLQGK